MNVFDIRDFGAVNDRNVVNTHSIQACIDTCSISGGTVLISQGVYVCGTLYLKSNVHLYVDESAVLMASPNIVDYGEDTHFNRYRNEECLDRCWFYACDQENITISGNGQLDGNAQAFPNENSIYRPMMLRFLRCRNIRLSGLRLFNAAAWTTAFLDSAYIWAENLVIKNEKQYNGDGLDFDGCSHVFIRGCSITGTDDNLCLQSGSREYTTENIHISGCEFTSMCAGIRIGLKSIGEIKNVVISDCTMKDVRREGIKVECTEGGRIANISVSNITMQNVARPIFILLNNRLEKEEFGSSLGLEEVPVIGSMQRLRFSGITAEDDMEMGEPHYRFGNDLMGAPWFNGIRVDAEKHHRIEGLTMENIYYHSFGGVKKSEIPEKYPEVLDRRIHPKGVCSENYFPDWSRVAYMDIRSVDGLYLSNIIFDSVEKDEREPYIIENCEPLKQEIFCR